MKKIYRVISISSAAFCLGLGLSFSSKMAPNEKVNNISNNVIEQTNENKDNSQNKDYENENDKIESNIENDDIEKNDTIEKEEKLDETINNNEETKNDIEKVESITTSGVFEGFADDNTIEINNNGAYEVFRVEDDSIRNILRNKEMGLGINFKYIEKNNSKVIIELN